MTNPSLTLDTSWRELPDLEELKGVAPPSLISLRVVLLNVQLDNETWVTHPTPAKALQLAKSIGAVSQVINKLVVLGVEKNDKELMSCVTQINKMCEKKMSEMRSWFDTRS